VADDDSNFDPLAGNRIIITEAFDLLDGDWIEGLDSSVESVTLSTRADESKVLLADGQAFTFFDDEQLVVYRREL
jgi:hypothetical protein